MSLPDFQTIHWYAQRAKAAYLDEATVRSGFPALKRFQLMQDIDVQYFLEVFPEQRLQVISVRGTANFENAFEDAEYIPAEDQKSGNYVHKGFERDAIAVLNDVRPYLSPGYKTRVTGHSLGAAISTLLMVMLRPQGILLDRSINFGQPKVTNAAGAKAFGDLPLTRVVDENDVVPRLPPITLLDSAHGFYEHFGDEVILLSGPYFAYETASVADKQSVGEFWKNLFHQSITEHYMDNYLSNIVGKMGKCVQVAYTQKNQYLA